MGFDADKALEIARTSVHCFFGDESSPFCDPVRDVIPDRSFIRLLTVKDEEVEELLKNNPY